MIQVYTAITNNHDPMREDIKVFTDWERFGSPLAAARFYKTAPELLFPEADWTIWVDGNVFLNVKPEALVEKCGTRTTGVFAHTHCHSLVDEAKAIIQGGYDTEHNVHKALSLYTDAEINRGPMAMTMVLVRKNHACLSDNAAWWQAMCYSSFRDQLTFPWAFPTTTWFELWPTVDFTKPNEFFTRVSL